VGHDPSQEEHSFHPELAGRRAECDGGAAVPGTRFASRQDFAGTLTGECVESGDPPWRWFRMTDLTMKPEGFAAEAVWCLEGNLYLVDADGPAAPPGGEAGERGRRGR